MRPSGRSLVAAGLVVYASVAPFAAQGAEQIPPPPLLFREVWTSPPHQGAETDVNMRSRPPS